MTDLFPSASSLSPRESWLRKNNLIVRDYQPPYGFNANHRWVCANRSMTRQAPADTQDAAEQRYCDLFGLKWWKLESWNEAMTMYAEQNQRDVMRCLESTAAGRNLLANTKALVDPISPNDVAVMIVME